MNLDSIFKYARPYNVEIKYSAEDPNLFKIRLFDEYRTMQRDIHVNMLGMAQGQITDFVERVVQDMKLQLLEMEEKRAEYLKSH